MQWNAVFWLLWQAEAAWFWRNVRGNVCATGPGASAVSVGVLPGAQAGAQHRRLREVAVRMLSALSMLRQVSFFLTPRPGNLEGTCVWLAALPRHFKVLPKIFSWNSVAGLDHWPEQPCISKLSISQPIFTPLITAVCETFRWLPIQWNVMWSKQDKQLSSPLNYSIAYAQKLKSS